MMITSLPSTPIQKTQFNLSLLEVMYEKIHIYSFFNNLTDSIFDFIKYFGYNQVILKQKLERYCICLRGIEMRDANELPNKILAVAKELANLGPGYAQQSAVLTKVKEQVPNSSDINVQQEILTAWHRLFREGLLSWGYNLDNPDAPYYHIPNNPH